MIDYYLTDIDSLSNISSVISNLMGNLPCCEGTIDSNTFRDYCSVAASEPYKPYLVQLQNREIHQTGEPQPSDQAIVLGNW